jgi:hypothetical protein
MPHWLYLGYLGFIPITWWTTNKVRAWASKWWSQRNCRWEAREYGPTMFEAASMRALPEVQTYCAGCDQIVPESWMAWFDADCDGAIGELYRCSVCRGVLDLDPVASQKAANDRMAEHFRIPGMRHGLVVNVDQMAHEQIVGRWQEQDFEALRGDDSLDLSQLLAPEYTAAVEDYRAAGIDATNETDRLYGERIAKRAQRRQAELRAKYHMDTGEWRNNVRKH